VRRIGSEDTPTVYAVRVAASARDALLAERDRRAELFGRAQAIDWYNGALAALRSLATYPERCTLAPEDDLLPEAAVRQLLYPPRRSRAWRLLFTVHEADADDPPNVRVHHARHSTQTRLSEWPREEDED